MNDESKSTPDWIALLLGIGLIAFAFYIYRELSQLEASGGSMRINWLFAAIYNLLGKWGVALVSALIGAVLCWRAFVPSESEED
jgi:putative effector of murein hydrolase